MTHHDDSYRASLYCVSVVPAFEHVHKFVDGSTKRAVYEDGDGTFLGYRIRLEWLTGGGRAPSGEGIGRHTFSRRIFKSHGDAVNHAEHERALSRRANIEVCDEVPADDHRRALKRHAAGAQS